MNENEMSPVTPSGGGRRRFWRAPAIATLIERIRRSHRPPA